jgi:hypothetical protein
MINSKNFEPNNNNNNNNNRNNNNNNSNIKISNNNNISRNNNNNNISRNNNNNNDDSGDLHFGGQSCTCTRPKVSLWLCRTWEAQKTLDLRKQV